MAWTLVCLLGLATGSPDSDSPITVRVALNAASDVDVAEVVARLAEASQLAVDRPRSPLRLPLEGRAAPLTKTLLGETLGPDASLEVKPGELVITLDPRLLEPDQKPGWARRLRDLASRAGKESERRARYGFHARASYHPNEPGRPTHSMGSLLARSYVEDDEPSRTTSSSLILIAPPNHGSSLAKAQTLLQMVQSVQASERLEADRPAGLARRRPGSGGRRHDARQRLSQGIERPEEARGRPLPHPGRGRRLPERRGPSPVRGKWSGLRGPRSDRSAWSASGPGSLDEITDGLGDGCVSVASTRLEGRERPSDVLHANHLELIRAPLLFPDPGPVASMPDLLRWLGEDRLDRSQAPVGSWGSGATFVNLVARRHGSILSHLLGPIEARPRPQGPSQSRRPRGFAP